MRQHTRSMVISRLGIVATSQVLASEAGAQILRLGGHAVDAAIAANAVLGVVEPSSCGVGGDLFAIVSENRSSRLEGINASGWSPSRLTRETLLKEGAQTMPPLGIHSVTVPGAVAGWMALNERFGRLPLSSLLAPAIYYCEHGFPLTEIIAEHWASPASLDLLRRHPNAATTFLPNDRAPHAGELFFNFDLAGTLREIAASRGQGFYRGSVAEAILAASRDWGGTLDASDLEEYHPEWIEPISTTYRGWTVSELPPNSQGIAALAMLNLMEFFPLRQYGHNSAKSLHVLIEAKKLAYADMLRYVGDPRFSVTPIKEMLSKSLALERMKEIRTSRANSLVTHSEFSTIAGKSGSDTIYLSVVDKDGNIVSLIQSNYSGFGSGVVPTKTGFMLQNRGALFSLEANHPNALEPRKRPLQTIIPAFMEKDGQRIGFGIMGGWNQAQAHAQFVSNVVDFDMNVQAALEAPRFTKLSFDGPDVNLENRIPASVCRELTELGHNVELLPPYAAEVGGGQAVMTDGSKSTMPARTRGRMAPPFLRDLHSPFMRLQVHSSEPIYHR